MEILEKFLTESIGIDILLESGLTALYIIVIIILAVIIITLFTLNNNKKREPYIDYWRCTIENDIEVSQTIDTQTTVNGIVNQQIKVQNKSEYIENGLVEISIPQGMTPIEDTLLNLKYDGKIEN